jgi:hypothetical protein
MRSQALQQLDADLDSAVTLLDAHEESHWAEWLVERRHAIETGAPGAIDALLRGFGGMGSFNDLLILDANGHSIDSDDEQSVNGRLGELRERIWQSATALRSEGDGLSSPEM